MLTSLLTRIVRLATAWPWRVIILAALLTAASGAYVARNFAINTDIGRLLESDAPWAVRDAAIGDAFPSATS